MCREHNFPTLMAKVVEVEDYRLILLKHTSVCLSIFSIQSVEASLPIMLVLPGNTIEPDYGSKQKLILSVWCNVYRSILFDINLIPRVFPAIKSKIADPC